MSIRYWLYKNNRSGGPAGYPGDWDGDVFSKAKQQQWGGSYSSSSPEVWRLLDEQVAAGDVMVAYQTDETAVIGYCVVVRIDGPPGDRRLRLQPIERLKAPFRIHRHKHGTPLARSSAVNGPVMLRELSPIEMETLLTLSGSPKRILQGTPKPGGYRP